MPSSWRLVDSGLVQPPESAAMDEAILSAHSEGLVPDTLHFYRRSVPTISVGYFQRISESVDLEECRRRGVAVVRRKSGGSSIYTDSGQLIYGLVLREDEVPADRAESFRRICTPLAEAVSSLGLDAVYRPMNDIEVGGRKVSGNAQLRRKGSVLQHGTIVVECDLEAMDAVLRRNPVGKRDGFRPSDRVAAISALLGREVDMKMIKDAVVAHLAASFDAVVGMGELISWERSLVAELVAEKYSRDDWNLRF